MRQSLRTALLFPFAIMIMAINPVIGAIVPELDNPPDGAVDLEVPVTFEFHYDDFATQFRIVIDDDQDFSSPKIDDTGAYNGLEPGFYTTSDLDGGTTYYWCIYVHGMSYWMRSLDTYHFTMAGCYIDAPVLSEPVNDSINVAQPVYLQWQEVAGAVEYLLQVDDNEDFSSPVYDFALPGNGTSIFFLDDGVTYYWRVKALKTECGSEWSTIWNFTTEDPSGISAIESSGLPESFRLYQNSPNPFNPITSIMFSLPKRQKVMIDIFNILGDRIETVLNQELPAGTWSTSWDGAQYPSGIYFYRIKTEGFTETKKMVLLK